ncbi:MAG: methyltransferase domain-containing protein [Nanoarchaeota archaeon]|nr:methyltransferase domain-containing protein [Nanoarchaeota archaeon]
MGLSERILLMLSKNPGKFVSLEDDIFGEGISLSKLRRVFPNFLAEIRGKRVLDYGCGYGTETIGLALNGAKYIAGLDINERFLEVARKNSNELSLSERMLFFSGPNEELKEGFDIVLSHNSMEHFSDPYKTTEDMKDFLKPGGQMYISFGPLWLSPRGSHMDFTEIPWVNVLFDEETVMRVRSKYKDDGAKKYEEVRGGLNKMTVHKFEKLIEGSQLEVIYMKYDCIKRLNFLASIPLAREFLINNVGCILKKK